MNSTHWHLFAVFIIQWSFRILSSKHFSLTIINQGRSLLTLSLNCITKGKIPPCTLDEGLGQHWLACFFCLVSFADGRVPLKCIIWKYGTSFSTYWKKIKCKICSKRLSTCDLFYLGRHISPTVHWKYA